MKRFTRDDLRFLKSCGVSVKGMRPARERRLECQQIFDPPLPPACDYEDTADGLAVRILEIIARMDTDELIYLRQALDERDKL